MKNKMSFKFWFPEQKRYIVTITLLTLVAIYYNKVIGAAALAAIIYFLYYNKKTSELRKEQWTSYIESLSADIDETVKSAIINLPIPICILEIDGNVNWYNNKFADIVQEKDILDKKIEAFIPNLNLRRVLNEKNEMYTNVNIGDKNFNVVYNIVKIENKPDSKYLIMVYFIENTKLLNLSRRYYAEKPVFGIIQIDSFDEVLESAGDDMRPLIVADVERTLKGWADSVGMAIKKTRGDRYVIFMENAILESVEKEKFNILDEVRDINYGNSLPLTLSIGIGSWGESFNKSLEYAESALDLALGRGGDQAVIKRKDKSTFYGGRYKGIEKKTKVKARLIAYALKDLVVDSDRVFIMGHKNADLDALGAALGVYSICNHLDVNASIVLQEPNSSIELLIDNIVKSGEYNNIFTKREEALKMCTRNSLLIVVDTHRPNITECRELLEATDRIVVIDHHRRGVEFIENAVLVYHETYASSASEMVTELIQYISEKPYLTRLESEALLAGITLDTKNFTFRTGVRTFEAAATLKKLGADTASVKKLFQGDVQTFFAKAEVIRQANIIEGKIAISSCPDGIENLTLVIAQGADELLNIKGIKGSFVLGRGKDGMIYVSARSMGDINVQVIMEKLGGGGHIDIAGAQIKDMDMEDAVMKLEEIITSYLEEVDL